MKKFLRLFLVVAALATMVGFTSCANGSSDDSSTSNIATTREVKVTTKTITIGSDVFTYKLKDGKVEPTEKVSVDANGNITITATSGNTLTISSDGKSITYKAENKTYEGTLTDSGKFSLVNKTDPKDTLSAESKTESKTETKTEPNNTYFFAEAVDGGVKFTVKALPAKFRGKWLGIFDDKWNSVIPKWEDQTKDWTGIFPFVSSGKEMKFTLLTAFNVSESVTITPTSGKGSINIPDAKASATITAGKITYTLTPEYNYKKMIPADVLNQVKNIKLQVEFRVDGNTIFAHVFDYNEEGIYILPCYDGNYKSLKNEWLTKYKDQDLTGDAFYIFNLPGSEDEFRTGGCGTAPVTPTDWKEGKEPEYDIISTTTVDDTEEYALLYGHSPERDTALTSWLELKKPLSIKKGDRLEVTLTINNGDFAYKAFRDQFHAENVSAVTNWDEGHFKQDISENQTKTVTLTTTAEVDCNATHISFYFDYVNYKSGIKASFKDIKIVQKRVK